MTAPTTQAAGAAPELAPAPAETAAPIEELGLSPETVELAQQQRDPTTFRQYLPELKYKMSELTERVEHDDEARHGPLIRFSVQGKAAMEMILQQINKKTATYNQAIDQSGVWREKQRVADVETFAPKLTQIIAEGKATLDQIAARGKAILGAAAEPDLPPTDNELAEMRGMAATYSRLSHAERNTPEMRADPKIRKMRATFHYLVWGGSKAEQDGVRLGNVKQPQLTPKQDREWRQLKAIAQTTVAVTEEAERLHKVVLKSADQRLLADRGLVTKPVSSWTPKERNDYITEYGIEKYERKLLGID